MAGEHKHIALPPPSGPPAGGHTSVSKAEISVPPAIVRPLQIAVGVVVALGLLGLVLFWPSGSADAGGGAYEGVTFHSGSVSQLVSKECAATTEDRLPDGSVPDKATCVTATVDLGEGQEQKINVPAQVSRAGLESGDRVRLVLYPAQEGEAATYAWSGYDRSRPLIVLALLFTAVILGVARWRGLTTLAGLLLTSPLLILFVLPALRQGEHAVGVALTSAVLMVTVLMYIAHGPTVRTTVAWLGTIGGILITTVLGWWFTGWAHLDGLSSQEGFTLGQLTSGAGLGGVVLAAIVIAGLGLLGDVAIAQVGAVWELRVVAPQLSTTKLFLRALRIGRDNMTSTFYTLVFAYLGASLTGLLLADVYQQPISDLLIEGQFSEQLARVMIGGIGLVLTVPVTTYIAAWVASQARPVHPAGVSPETAMLILPRGRGWDLP